MLTGLRGWHATAGVGRTIAVVAERLAPPTIGDRIRWFGWLSWMMIGIIALASSMLILAWFIIFRSPFSALIAPVGIAFVVVYLLNPVVSLLERRGVNRALGVTLVFAIFLGVVATALRFFIPVVADQLSGFIDKLPDYVRTIAEEVEAFAARNDIAIDFSTEDIAQTIQDNRETIVSLLGGVRSFAGQLVHVIVAIGIGFILSIYLLLDLPKIQRTFRSVVPVRMHEEVFGLLDRVGLALGGFFRGQLLVATFVGVATAIGLSLVKLDFAILIGLIAGIFNLVPLIGPFLAAIPAVLVGLLSGQPSKALWSAVVLLIVQQIDNHIVSPNVMGRTVKLHPITVMLALLTGATIAGILGMLVVIPSVAVGKLIVLHLWTKRGALGLPVRAPQPEG